MRARLLKYLVTGFVFLVLGLFWAFSHFFFNPFEGVYEGELATLIPRDVDFYVEKKNLEDAFDPFPRLAFLDRLARDPSGQALLELQVMQDLLEGLDLEGLERTLEENLAAVPIEVDPLEVLGGKDLALAGYFRGAELGASEWAVYGRMNWLGKLAVEGIHGRLADFSSQGITVGEIERGFSLSGGALARPLYVTRVLDVVVVSTMPELVAAALALDQARGQDSFWFSAKYSDHASRLSLEGDELNVYVDQNHLLETLRKPGTWPDPRAEDLASRLLARLFQLGSVREHMLTLSFGNGVTFDVSGAISSEHLSAVQKKLYRMRGFEKEEVLELARMAPADVGLFACGQGPLNEVLNELAPAVDTATLSLVEDAARNVFGYADVYPLLGDFSAAFGDRFAFFVRNNDYPPDVAEDPPPADGAEVAAWTLVFPIDDGETLENLRAHVKSNPSAFGIAGRDPAKGGIFTNGVAGGGVVWEYHSAFIPGTGHLATIEVFGNAGATKYFLLSNNHKMLGQAFTTYRKQRPQLAEANWFQTLVNTGLGQSDFVLWFNPRAFSESMRAIAAQSAEFDIALAIDWERERPNIEKRVLKEHFPGERHGAVSPENREAFELLAQQEIDRFQAEFTKQHLPRLRAERTRAWTAAELTSATLLQLALDPKSYVLHGRIVVPLDGAGAVSVAPEG